VVAWPRVAYSVRATGFFPRVVTHISDSENSLEPLDSQWILPAADDIFRNCVSLKDFPASAHGCSKAFHGWSVPAFDFSGRLAANHGKKSDCNAA
jgi:hypothetical protein